MVNEVCGYHRTKQCRGLNRHATKQHVKKITFLVFPIPSVSDSNHQKHPISARFKKSNNHSSIRYMRNYELFNSFTFLLAFTK